MKQFELEIEILDKDYADDLVIALARQGYAPYFTEKNKSICIGISEADLFEIKYEKKYAIEDEFDEDFFEE